MGKDILKDIPDTDLPLLSELFKKHENEAPHVYSLINTCIKWKKKKPDSKYLTFMGVNNDWLKTGTFILLMQYSCYDLFIFTLEKDCKVLYEILTQTKRIDWSKKIIWYAVLSRHVQTVFDIIKELKLTLSHATDTELWVIEKEKALEFDINCPDDVYIGKLNKSHAALVSSQWPHRFKESEQYLATFIEMNNSCGIFLKSDDSLVCWVLKSHLGQLVVLQTMPEHKKKGYATLVTKAMSKEIAQEGHIPLGTVVKGNVASETMFKKLGFRPIDICTYFETF